MQSVPSLLSLPGPLCPGVVASDRALSMGQIELNCGFELIGFAFKLRIHAKLNCSKENCLLTLKLYYAKLNCS